jgi:hypothetical protein
MPLQIRFAHTIRFQIHYVFNIVRVPRHEFRCVDFQASSPGCEEERRLHFVASGKRDEDHPSEIADRTKGHFDFLTIPEGRARVAPHILPVQPDAALCVVSRWWTAMHYISRRNRKSS